MADVNNEDQYSIWPANRENPLGWQDAGKTGTKGRKNLGAIAPNQKQINLVRDHFLHLHFIGKITPSDKVKWSSDRTPEMFICV
ncbi:MbtH family NRPS accessory protein [Nostoc linckia FACHB-391]|uniref:MbtH family NRPS accessory protein n=2 Tax=Nostoc TaxID=1177 RepID=A0ABR8ICZ5_9NOSO|nr:MbtH family NRPS accessory protein [Nostoc linckia FACHB-391]MBD2648671.1 MbtH family NRPS accessory protein [Nostoc foliaceum FACHB-393]